MTKARIYKPAKNAMQSGKGKTHEWLLEFAPETPYFIDGLMGWNAMSDTVREIKLRFPTKEAAVAYANKQGIEFEHFSSREPAQNIRNYADNFAFNRVKR